MSPVPFVTVVVCTRNRASKLAATLAAALGLDFPRNRWEIVIVDNASTDETAAIAGQIAEANPGWVRLVTEPRAGVSHARNTGVRESRGDVIAFLDDDAIPEPQWLQALVDALGWENVLAVGGPVEPLFEGPVPDWLTERFLPYLSAWDRGPEIRSLRYNDYPRGANMAFRRSVFETVGGFSPQLGRSGGSLLSGEETEFCLRIERAGGNLVYVPGARICHLTPTARLTPQWLRRRFRAQGLSEALIEWRHAGLKGMRRGRTRWRLMMIEERDRRSPVPEDQLYLRCLRSGLAGHRMAILRLLAVPRYRPAAGKARDWLPAMLPG